VNIPKLSDVSSRYGAPFGRRDTLPEDPAAPVRLCLRRLPMVDGCYDRGWAYWGAWSAARGGMWISWADGVRVFVRAKDRTQAAALVREKVPGAIIRKVGAS